MNKFQRVFLHGQLSRNDREEDQRWPYVARRQQKRLTLKAWLPRDDALDRELPLHARHTINIETVWTSAILEANSRFLN